MMISDFAFFPSSGATLYLNATVFNLTVRCLISVAAWARSQPPSRTPFDFSLFAQNELTKRNRFVIEKREDIPRHAFQYILSSHCLEHSPAPYQDLQEFHEYALPGGYLVLVLPVEVELRPALQSDWNLHLQAWTFQTITNLLVSTGWTPLSQSLVYGPYLLRTLGRRLSANYAIPLAYRLGRLIRANPSMLTIARAAE